MRSLLTALTLVCTVSAASAQPLDAPTYSVGDTWTLKEGSGPREVTVLKVGEGGATEQWDFSASAFLRARYENYELNNRVDKIEEVKTPGGLFKAYRIVRDVTLKGGQAMGRSRDTKWQTTVWFAPDVKFVVKSTSTNPNAQDTELLSYRVK